MKGEKEQPDFIAEAFKMKIISAFPPANEQMIIHVLSLIYDWYERFISFRLCNNNPPGISILKINYITILAAPNRRYICKIYKWCFRQRSNSFFAFFLGIHLTNNFIIWQLRGLFMKHVLILKWQLLWKINCHPTH